VVWVALLVFLVVAGCLVWAIRTGRMPEELRRCLSWWLDLEDRPVWQRRAADTPDGGGIEDEEVWIRSAKDDAFEEDTPGTEADVLDKAHTTAGIREPVFNRSPDVVPAFDRETVVLPKPEKPLAPAVSPPWSSEPLPLINLDDVASHLKNARYRTLPQHKPAAASLPVLDTDAIRDNMRSRVRHVSPRLPSSASLPVIGPEEVEHNLLKNGGRVPPSVSGKGPLPMINPDEVRASLQQIHGSRIRSRSQHAPAVEALRKSASAPLKVTTSGQTGSRPQPLVAQPPIDSSRPALPTTPVSRPLVQTQAPVVPPIRQDMPKPVGPPPRPEAAVPPASQRPVIPVVAPSWPLTCDAELPSSASRAFASGDQPVSTPVVRPRPVTVSPVPVIPETAQKPMVPVPLVRPVAPCIQPVPVVPDAPVRHEGAVVVPDVAGADVQVEPDIEDAVLPTVAAPLVWRSIEERSPEPEPELTVEPVDEPAALPFNIVEPVASPMPMRVCPAYDAACLPGLDLLNPAEAFQQEACSEDILLERGIVIEEKLAEFKVKVSVVDAYAGPVITRFEVEPAVGVRGSQVVNLIKDLARALGLASIRVVETIPGKTCMGLELPNPVRQMIRLSEILASEAFNDRSPKLTLALGKDITGEPVVMDLARAPHLLVAGTTGSGKSVGVNAMILSLLYKFTPNDVRFIMIDPKMLELSVYNDIPHLLAPVVTDMKLAANALNWCVGEMEKRYRLMSALGVRNLAGFNEKVAAAAASGMPLANPFTVTPDNPERLETLPAIVVVVDEFADLMMVAGKKIEELIARLAQKARAAGIHLILATQRPSVDVITGLIKANIPTRIAFQVSSKVDSRTILDQMGAEALLGQGDMLYLPPGSGYPQRIHGAFVTDDEVHHVVEHLKQFGEPDYVEGLLTGEAELDEEATANARGSAGPESDPLYDEAVEIVLRTRKASISSVQRHLRIGYNRAARLIEEMEAAGMVSAMESNGNRTVLVPQREM